MDAALTIAVSDAQLDGARHVELDGLSAHTLLLEALAPGRGPGDAGARALRAQVDARSAAAFAVMHDGDGTFAPSFVIPDGVDDGSSRRWSESVADADASSLERLLGRVYGARIPVSWQRVLDAPRPWLHDLGRAHAAIAPTIVAKRQSEQARRSFEARRFEAAQSSRAALAMHVAATGRFRLGRSSISTPWVRPVRLSFSGDLRFAPLLGTGGKFVLVRDVEGRRDVDVVIAQGLPAPQPRAGRQAAIDLLAGPARAAILRHVSTVRSVNDIARALHYTPATVSYHVGRLEQAGLVDVVRQEGRSWVRLSATGETLVDLLG